MTTLLIFRFQLCQCIAGSSSTYLNGYAEQRRRQPCRVPCWIKSPNIPVTLRRLIIAMPGCTWPSHRPVTCSATTANRKV